MAGTGLQAVSEQRCWRCTSSSRLPRRSVRSGGPVRGLFAAGRTRQRGNTPPRQPVPTWTRGHGRTQSDPTARMRSPEPRRALLRRLIETAAAETGKTARPGLPRWLGVGPDLLDREAPRTEARPCSARHSEPRVGTRPSGRARATAPSTHSGRITRARVKPSFWNPDDPCIARTPTPTGRTSESGCSQDRRCAAGRTPPLLALPRISRSIEARLTPAEPDRCAGAPSSCRRPRRP